jgi:hypothetical protein
MPRLAAALLLTTAVVQASAQTVYRCGNAYSQQPCPNARVVDVSDSRSNAQKARAKQAIEQTEKAAQQLAQTRLKQENANASDAFTPEFVGALDNTAPESNKKNAAAALFTAKSMPSAKAPAAATSSGKTPGAKN